MITGQTCPRCGVELRTYQAYQHSGGPVKLFCENSDCVETRFSGEWDERDRALVVHARG